MVLESRHTRLAAAHGAVCNMEAELAKHALLPGLVANDLLELYDRALVPTPLNESLIYTYMHICIYVYIH
eukprot:COSAG03_NODE_14872_length_449_cov_0.891429_1_plen_70_part_00